MFSQKAFAIVVTPVGPQREGRVPEIAQITDGLTVGRPSKTGIAQDRFFQLGVGDLALGHGGRAGRAEEHCSEKDPLQTHHGPDEPTEAAKRDGLLLPVAFRLLLLLILLNLVCRSKLNHPARTAYECSC
jgi:hypothetical protein